MLRDTIYEGGCRSGLRRRLHLAAGKAFERQATDKLRSAAGLALHFSRGGDYRRALRYARTAAEKGQAQLR